MTMGKIKVVHSQDGNTAITLSDRAMDRRAQEAVGAAIRKAEVCNKPIARYDRKTGGAYLQFVNGEKVYVR